MELNKIMQSGSKTRKRGPKPSKKGVKIDQIERGSKKGPPELKKSKKGLFGGGSRRHAIFEVGKKRLFLLIFGEGE